MSIVASVKVFDGVVLGADSQATIFLPGPDGKIMPVKAYSNARKLFHLTGYPIGLMAYGSGNIGKRSVESFVLEFNERFSAEAASVEMATTELLKFLRERYLSVFGSQQAEQQPVLGVFVAGYSKFEAIPEEWEFQLPKDTSPHLVRPKDDFGASWRGIARPFTRLYRGLDPMILQKLRELGVTPEIIAQIEPGMMMPMVFDNMPLQDAVDFVEFILNLTISVSRFELGVASTGGPIEIAVVRRDLGFKWVKRKPLEAIISPEAAVAPD